MNHAQFSNGEVKAARGDLPTDVPHATQSGARAGMRGGPRAAAPLGTQRCWLAGSARLGPGG